MAHTIGIPADAALARLRRGNAAYAASGAPAGDISAARRAELAAGQAPFAVIVACSDSRVAPEAIFGCGLGDIFVIRLAGNVMGGHALGSVQYAVEHLGTRLVVVLGHTHCGAVAAAIAGEEDGLVGMITRDIHDAIGDTTDPREASIINAQHSADAIRMSLGLAADDQVKVVPALYDIEAGTVCWLGA